MSVYSLLVFALIYGLAVATPGPGIAAVIARALGRGVHGAPAFIGGFLAGDLIWFSLAALGLAVLAQRAHTPFVVVRFVGAAYLLYLAWRLWRAPPGTFGARSAAPPEKNLQIFLGALALTLGNPKTMVFFLAVLPTVVDLAHLRPGGFLGIAFVMVIVLPAVLGAYTLFAARARARLSQPRTVRWLQRGTGAVLAGAAVAVAIRS
jgi:threonine/homoserine/homoserine lactone efflux protein